MKRLIIISVILLLGFNSYCGLKNKIVSQRSDSLHSQYSAKIIGKVSNLSNPQSSLGKTEIRVFYHSVTHSIDGYPEINRSINEQLIAATNAEPSGHFEIEIPLRDSKDYVYVQVVSVGMETLVRNVIKLNNANIIELNFELTPNNPTSQEKNKIDEFFNTLWEEKNRSKSIHLEAMSKEMPLPIKSANDGQKMSCTYSSVPTLVFVSNLVNGYNSSTSGSGFTGYINFDLYIAGVVQGELGGLTSILDVSKAQAVAARTFSLERHINGLPVNIGQAYNDSPSALHTMASSSTSEEVILYNGNVITARYSARCNGMDTQNGTEGTWSPYVNCNTSGAYYPYLLSVQCSGHINCGQTNETPCCYAYNSASGSSGYIYGHGVGMCQRGIMDYGANYGWSYCQMLEHYYTGVCIANSNCGGTLTTLNCSNAVPLSCGVTYSAGSSSAPSNVSTYGCNNWTETGPERVHTITTTGNGTITATISNFSGDLDVYILGSCDPMDCLGSVSSSSATYTNAQAGQTYYIVVDSDDGSGSGYDLIVDCPPTPPGEDIFVTNESVTPTSVNPGDIIDISLDANYTGNQTTSMLPTFNLEYYFGASCDINSATYFDDDLFGIGTNDPFDTETTTYQIPNGTPPGQYYILVFVDSDHELIEINETNNVVCIPITVLGTPPGDNISLSNANVTPNIVAPGDLINIGVDCNYSGNQTTTNLPTFDLEYYFSPTCDLNGATLFDTDLFSVGTNDPTDYESTTYMIPNGTPSGQYYILIFADSDYELSELDETDNLACIPITVQGNPQDLVLSNGQISNTNVSPGDNVYVSIDHEYIGTQLSSSLPDIRLDMYLSNDCDPNGFDSLLQFTYSNLGADNSVETEGMYVQIPQNTVPGSWNIIFVSDSDAQIPEVDEVNNNKYCFNIEVVDPAVSVNEIAHADMITLFPNPASEVVNYNSGDLVVEEVRLFDMQGRLLSVSKGDSGSIDIRGVAKGRYFVHFYIGDHPTIIKELVKL